MTDRIDPLFPVDSNYSDWDDHHWSTENNKKVK